LSVLSDKEGEEKGKGLVCTNLSVEKKGEKKRNRDSVSWGPRERENIPYPSSRKGGGKREKEEKRNVLKSKQRKEKKKEDVLAS